MPCFKTEIIGVNAGTLRPTSDDYGATVGQVVRCSECSHRWVMNPPGIEILAEAYAEADDPVSVREEAGQLATARRDLEWIERSVAPGRVVDLGCWTGSFLVAADERGWQAIGVEPSQWASDRARERGLDVRTASLDSHGLPNGSMRLVAMLDVIEHLADPGRALDAATTLLEPRGGLFVTTPDAHSPLARMLGRHWWSVLPMHLQYFTRQSLVHLLARHGFEVRDTRTHAKVFTMRYYAERLSGYSTMIGRGAVSVLNRMGIADRLLQPDMRDRMAVIAVKRH